MSTVWRRSAQLVVTLALFVVGTPLLRALPKILALPAGSWQPHAVVVASVTIGGAVLAATLRSRLAAVAALGATGVAVAVLFVLFSAPDLAMTQTVAETLGVILLVLVFYHLPRVVPRTGWGPRLRDLGFAVAVGVVMSLLVLAAATYEPDLSVSEYYLAQSEPAAHGRNVVNVILVDFRAMDTLGEITVLAVAGLGVYALLRLRLSRRKEEAS